MEQKQSPLLKKTKNAVLRDAVHRFYHDILDFEISQGIMVEA